MNQAWADLFKVSKQEVFGKNTAELGISRDPEARASLYAELEQLGCVKDREITSYYSRSGEAPVLLVDQEMLDIRGRKYVLTLSRDITERKRAEERLRESEAQLRGIIDNLQDAYFRADLSGRFTVVSSSAVQMFGYDSVEEMIGLPAVTLYAQKEDRSSLLEEVRKCGRVNDWVTQGKRKDGSIFWVSMGVQACRNGAGKIVGSEGTVRDITERKRNEQETARLASFPIMNPNPTVEADLNGNVLFINPTAQKLFPDLRERGTKHPFLIGWENLKSSCFNSGNTVQRDIAVLDRWYSQTVHYLEEFQQFRIYSLDITKRKQAEKELEDSEHRYRQLVQLSPDAIVVHRRGNFLYANAAALNLFGAAGLGQLKERNLLDLIHPADKDAVLARIQRIETGEKLPLREIRVIGLDGRVIDIEAYASRVTFGEEHKAIQVIIRDITERKRAERLNQAIHDVDQAVHSTLNTQEVMKLALGKAREAIGCETAAISLREGDAWRVSYVLDFPDSLIGACMSDKEELHAVLAVTTRKVVAISDAFSDPRVNREHMKKWAVRSVLVVPLIAKDSTLGVLLLNYHKKTVRFDSADLNFAERLAASLSLALENSRLFESLEEKVRERTKELAVRADQLRALAGELTISEQRERRRLASLLHDHLQQILVGAKFRLSLLGKTGDEGTKLAAREIEELVDESIKSSRFLTAELSPPILHDAGLNAGLEWLGRRMADVHGLFVDLTTEPIGPLPEDLTIMLFESVRELLFNVAKHAGTHSASVRLNRTDASLQLTISDKGVGFDPATFAAAGITGKGFGLFSVRERLELFGGNLLIDSAPGRGSRFVVSIPVTMVESGPAGLVELPKEVIPKLIPKPHPGKKIRILLADDHAVVRQGIGNLLSDEDDMEVVGSAADGQEAVSLASKLLPDVILMDVNMPRLNGIEATRVIHNDYSDIGIIGLSMFEEAEKAQAMRDAGATNYLTKSGPAEELLEAVRAAFRHSQKALSTKTRC